MRISPSSDGVEIKTGYLGLPTRRVLSREQLFRKIRKGVPAQNSSSKKFAEVRKLRMNSLAGLLSGHVSRSNARHLTSSARDRFQTAQINKIGYYEAMINLHSEIQAKVHIEVVKKEEEN